MAATQSITVSAKVWEQFQDVQGGKSVKDTAAAHGIGASTVTANVKRIREAMANGRTVNVNGQDTPAQASTGTTAIPEVDPRALADSIHPMGTLILDVLDKDAAEVSRLRDQVAALEAQIPQVEAHADAAKAMGAAAGFNVDAYREALAKAQEERAAKVKTLEDAAKVKAEAEAAKA